MHGMMSHGQDRFTHQQVISVLCYIDVLARFFCREGVLLEPLHEWHVRSCACELILRGMDVGVHKTWNKKLPSLQDIGQ